MHDSSALRYEAAKARLVVIASAAKQSILSFLVLYGLLRFARNDGAARWIASRSLSSGARSRDGAPCRVHRSFEFYTTAKTAYTYQG